MSDFAYSYRSGQFARFQFIWTTVEAEAKETIYHASRI